ncbi:MAG: sugar ABC transporter permease [Micrococcales bacterium]|nr:sugar ABC transporter permease [Micrococcales bacterium]
MNYVKQVLGGDLRKYTMALILLLVLAIFHFLTNGLMLTSQNIVSLLMANTYVFILAMGMLMVIVVGHIDLSVGSVAGFVGMMSAVMYKGGTGAPWWVCILIGLGIGVGVGAWQGFWLAKMGIPGFITTLAGMMVFRGAVIWVAEGRPRPAPPELKTFGYDYIRDWPPGVREHLGVNLPTILIGAVGILIVVFFQFRSRAKIGRVLGETPDLSPVIVRSVLIALIMGFFTYLLASGRENTSVPIPTLIVLVLVILYSTLTQRTPLGRHIYAVGGAKAAAALSGVSIPKTYFFTLFNMSILAALAGLLATGRTGSAAPADGNMWELDAIASVFIGGAAVTGGIGTISGTMIGALVMASINSGLNLMHAGSDKTMVIKGLVLLAAVALDVFNKQQGRASITGRLFGKKPGEEIQELTDQKKDTKEVEEAVSAPATPQSS